jgi:hypothetical protein
MPPFADPERSVVTLTFADGPAVAPEAAEPAPALPCVGSFSLDAPVVFAEILAADQPEMGAGIRLLSPAPSPQH